MKTQVSVQSVHEARFRSDVRCAVSWQWRGATIVEIRIVRGVVRVVIGRSGGCVVIDNAVVQIAGIRATSQVDGRVVCYGAVIQRAISRPSAIIRRVARERTMV